MIDLQRGMDFRLPEHRWEVFLRFYEFQLTYRAHPGLVYQFIPYLSNYFGWHLEERLWYATINAFTQHPMTSLTIFQRQPEPFSNEAEVADFWDWFDGHWFQLPFDTDRKYQKKECPVAMQRVSQLLWDSYGTLKQLYTGSFTGLWQRMRRELYSLGRLGAWSGLEFIKIAAGSELTIEFDSLMLRDIDGSKSHRNGLCILLGRDDLDWHEKLNPRFTGKYTEDEFAWLEESGARLLTEARERFANRDFIHHVGYETLESTLCCYKSWHRPNRRYPNVYSDMAYGRLLDTAQKNPTLDLTPFWEARRAYLPKELRIEDNPQHPQHGKIALDRGMQNLYRETGRIHTMGVLFDCFEKPPQKGEKHG